VEAVKGLVLAALCLILAAGGAAAQDMHKGIIDDGDCLSCHVEEGSAAIDRANCLGCHTAIEKGLARETGYHYTSVIARQQDCGACHREHEAEGQRLTAWNDEASKRRFDHAPTGFALTDTHAKLLCERCHNTERMAAGASDRANPAHSFQGLDADCASCHESPHGRPLDCALCHRPTQFADLRTPAIFDHAADTGFALEGAHAEAACAQCHADLRFARVGVSCADCHQDVAHRGELGFDCARCHTPHDWKLSSARLVEHQQTRFPLLGRHALMDCEACHTNVQRDEFVGLPTDCIGCHGADWATTASPNHAQLGFGTDCQQCHSVSHLFWTEARFAHTPSFPLTQGHAGVDCATCHVAGQALPAGDDCFACHTANNPPHIAGGFPSDCLLCHTPTSFEGVATYAHAASGFPGGVGQHAQADCLTCHTSGVYAGMPADCFLCHSADYNGTQNPDHQDVGLPTNCEWCHTPTSWNDVLAGKRWEVTR
jgi:hypothetical protein